MNSPSFSRSSRRFLPAFSQIRGSWALLLMCLGLLVAAPLQAQLPVKVNFESGTITLAPGQASATTWQSYTFTRSFNGLIPVVILGPAYSADGEPHAVRVRNITATGFQWQIDEWDYLAGAHTGTVTAQFIAATQGTHVFGSQRWQVGKVTGVNRANTTVTLTGFSAPPMVLTQVESTANLIATDNPRALKTRNSAVTAANFAVNIETQESYTTAITNENIGYIAVSEGIGYLDGKTLWAYSPGTVTHSIKTFYAGPFTNPVMIAQTQTKNDANPGDLRMSSLPIPASGQTRFQVAFQEETSSSTDVTHTAEDMAGIFIGDMPGEAAAKMVFGTVTPAQTSATLWHKVNLGTAYTAPVVVFGPLTKNDAQAAGIRVRNVLAADPLNSNRASFEYQVDEWDFADGIHALETVQYMVMEEGIFAIGGQVIQAGRQTGVTNVAQTVYTSTDYWASDIYFEREPAVFTQVTTTAEASAVTARVDAVDTFYDWPTNFRLRLTEAENANQTHAAETVHYIVVPGGIGQFMSSNSNFRFACGVASNLSSTLTNNSFVQKYAKPSIFAAAQGTEEATLDIDGFYETAISADLDPILLRQTALNAGSVNLVADEDASPSANNTHTTEVGGWFVVQGLADADGDGVTDLDETQMGTSSSLATSPNNASGGTATDFDTLQSLLSLSVTAPTPTAFETNDKKANPLTHTNGILRVQRSSGTMQLTLRATFSGNGDATKGVASPSDYTLSNITGNTLVIAANQATTASPLNITVTPVRDSIMEVPEHLKIALGPVPAGANPQIVNPSATLRICDANPAITNNRTLWVAYLSRAPNVVSTGSGVAVAVLPGDNDQASVSTTISGLSSPHNTTYLRINNDQDIRNNLGVGDLSNVAWPIRFGASETTDQAMLDALRLGRIYCDINTVNYTAGEIMGYFNQATGDPGEFDPTREDLIEPDLPGTLTAAEAERDIYRFLDQCTFGATTALYNSVKAKVDAIDPISNGVTSDNLIAGYTAWLTDQMAVPSINFMSLVMAADNEEFLMRGAKPIQAGNDPQFAGAGYTATYDAYGNITNPYNNASNNAYAFNYPQNGINKRREWWTMVLNSQDQVRQRMAAALQEIVVISDMDTTVAARHYGAANYYDMLLQNAFGKYRTILEKVTYSPMMGIYLSHLRNRAQYTSGGVDIFPDENYAREIMQLFTIGLVLRHPDGGLMLDATTGLPIPTYNQTDITELARVLTGLTYGARHASVPVRRTGQGGVLVPTTAAASPQIEIQGVHYTDFTGSAGELFFQAPWIYPMKGLGRVSGVVYHDFNPYVAPNGTVSGTDSKVLFAGKEGETHIPLVNITGMSDMQTHPLVDEELRLAHNALAGDPTSSSYNGHQNTPVFISRQLIQRLTSSNPSPGYLYRVTKKYIDTNGTLSEVLKTILLDYEARSLQVADSLPGAGKLKEPLVQHAAMLRSLKASSGASITNLQNMTLDFGVGDSPSTSAYAASEAGKFPAGATRIRMGDLTNVIGQSPQRAPSVFNWFLPDYVQPGIMADANLYGPELQINTESMLVNRVNRHYAINLMGLTGGYPGYSMDDFTVNSANMAPRVLTDVTTLTFTAANWNTAQTVTVRGHENFAGDGTRSTSILHTVASGDTAYSGTYTAPINFTVRDNDVLQAKLVVVAQTGGSTAVTEAGATDTYRVVLSAPPASGQTVTVTPSAVVPWQVAAAPAASPDVTVSPASLTFNTTNWNVAQTVTVTAVDNTVVNSFLVASAPLNARVATIRHTVTSGDPDYSGSQVSDFNCTVNDNETGRRFIPTKATATGIPVVTEGSTTDTYTVAFASGTAPTQPVTLTFNYDNSRLSLSSTDGTFTQVSPGVATVSFTSSTYATAKTITVAANNESAYQGVQFRAITHTITSADTTYNALPAAPINVRINDNDSATNNGISIIQTWGATQAVEGGMTDQYFVVLDKAPSPSANVVLTWSGNNGDVSGIGNITFTPTNWWVPVAVTVSGTEDLSVETTKLSTIKYTAAGGGYNMVKTVDARIGDNDQNSSAGITVTQSGGTTAVTEGSTTDTFDVKLTGAPAGEVLITTTVSPAQATLSATSMTNGILTFTPNNWNTTQVVTVTANNDTVAEGAHSAGITMTTSSTDPRYNNFPIGDIPVTITDNDNGARLVLTHTSGVTEVVEGGAGDPINVNFAGPTPPATPVTVNVASTAGATVSPTTLTFNSTNWTTPQAVTVTAVNDATTEAYSVETITVSTDAAQPSGFANLSNTASATVFDNDDLNNGGAITIVQTNTATRVVEGGMTDTFEVVLRRAPTGTVTLTPSFAPAGQVNLSVSNLTFTTANWFIPQTVTVTAVDDATVENAHSTTLTYTANLAGGYVPQDIATLAISIGDNEAGNASVAVSPTTGSVTEGGATFTYNVTLGVAPVAGATLRITPVAYWNNATNSGQVTFSPTSRDFTSASALTASFVVTATDSTLAEALTNLKIVHTVNTTVANADPRYTNMVAADVSLAVNDNDTNVGRIVITESSNSTLLLEDAGTDTVTVALVGPSAPASDVTVNLVRSTNQFRFVINGTPVDTATLTFTPTNYTTAQTLTLVSVPDTTSEGVHTDTLTASTTSSAPANYQGMSTALPIRILDSDDIARALINLVHSNGSTRVVEGGTTDTYSVFLRRAPTAAGVTLTAHFNSQLSLSPANLTFTSANWNRPQTVTVTAVNDLDVENAHSAVVTYTASATGGYLTTDTVNTGAIMIGDNDSRGTALVTITESGGYTWLSENLGTAASDTYTVVLGAAPSGNVDLTPQAWNTVGGANLVTFSPSVLTFTTANWSTPQTVTINLAASTANNNASTNTAPRAVFIGHKITTTDLTYRSYAVPNINAIVSEANDATAGIFIIPTGANTTVYEGTAGNSDSVYVFLRKQPTADVTVTPSFGTAGQCTASPASLTFTNANWNRPQILTINATNDTGVEVSPTTVALTCTPSATGGYVATNTGTHNVIVNDNDATGQLVITQNGNSILEGGFGTYSVKLSSQPTADVVVTIVTEKHAQPSSNHAVQYGYFTNGATGSNQQKDNVLFDWTELTTLYTNAYNADRAGAAETTATAPNGHLAGTKAVIDKLDQLWGGGRMKAKWPDGSGAADNPRLVLIEAIHNSYSLTRLSTDTVNFPNEVLNRCRFASYLVSISPAAVTSH